MCKIGSPFLYLKDISSIKAMQLWTVNLSLAVLFTALFNAHYPTIKNIYVRLHLARVWALEPVHTSQLKWPFFVLHTTVFSQWLIPYFIVPWPKKRKFETVLPAFGQF